jgi:ribosome-associated translation inhibitor RaiA
MKNPLARAAKPGVLKRGRLRAMVRVGSRDVRTSPLQRRSEALRDGTVCERCGAVYRKRRWRRGPAEDRVLDGFVWGLCPACVQVEAGEYYGRVTVRGARALRDEAALRRRIRNVAARAGFTQPERRIVSIDRQGDAIEVLTTSQKLAHRIVRSLLDAFGGCGSYSWSDRDGELRAVWSWDEPSDGRRSARRAPAGGRAVRRPERRAPREPELEIRARHVRIEPAWRRLVREQLDAWTVRHPDLTLLRVTLSRTRHHRQGVEQAAAQLVAGGRILHAAREAETMTAAIREVLGAVDREFPGRDLTRRRAIRRRPARV